MPTVIKPYPTQPFALPPNPGVRTVEPAPATSRAREDVPPPQGFTPIHYIDPASPRGVTPEGYPSPTSPSNPNPLTPLRAG